jgi:hypothetical protein
MKKCKVIKKAIYKDINPRERAYKQLPNGQVVADIYRAVYQDSKKECKNMTKKEVKEHLKRKEVK